MGFADLLENFAVIYTIVSSCFWRVTSNNIFIPLSDTTIDDDVGRLSSGNAELKFQSSSTGPPFVWLVLSVLVDCEVPPRSSNVLDWFEEYCGGKDCWGVEGENAAKGSNGGGGFGVCCCCCCCWRSDGAGVVDCDVG